MYHTLHRISSVATTSTEQQQTQAQACSYSSSNLTAEAAVANLCYSICSLVLNN